MLKMKAKVKDTGSIVDVYWVGMDMETRENMYVSSDHVRYFGKDLVMPSTKEILDAQNL